MLKVEPLSLSFEQKVMKRVMDLVLSVIESNIDFSIYFLVIALMIKLEDKGPVFYKQRKCKNNKIFELYKFEYLEG